MSHVSALSMTVAEEELPMVKQVAENLGLVFNEGQTSHKWYGRWVNDYGADDAAYHQGIKPEDYGKCSHALSVPGNPNAYEVGLVKTENNKYKFVFDFWAGGQGLCAHIGPKGEKLLQEIGTQRALNYSEKFGFKLESLTQLDSKQMRIEISKKTNLY